jgi:hypothetical protein
MIPANNILSTRLVLRTQPSKDYKLDIEHDIISGTCDGLESMKQVIYKILNTERYQNIIYSWNYGIELQDLLGKSVAYVCSELARRITEALVQDDRIEAVNNFEFDITEKRTVKVTFTVRTIFGDVEEEQVVNF